MAYDLVSKYSSYAYFHELVPVAYHAVLALTLLSIAAVSGLYCVTFPNSGKRNSALYVIFALVGAVSGAFGILFLSSYVGVYT